MAVLRITTDGANGHMFGGNARTYHGRPGSGRPVTSRTRARASELEPGTRDARQPRRGGRPYPGLNGNEELSVPGVSAGAMAHPEVARMFGGGR